MSNFNYITGAISCSNGIAYTGSFLKIQALGDAGDVECVLDRVEWGTHSSANPIPPHSSSITRTTGPIEIPAGSSIEGPIVQFKVGTNGVGKGFLAYEGS